MSRRLIGRCCSKSGKITQPELDDPKWINSNLRRAHADYINAQVTSFTSRFLKEDLAELMQKHGIPGLPVNSPSDFMKDPHIQARGFFSTVTHPVLGTVPTGGEPVYGRRQTGRAVARAAFGPAQRRSVLRRAWIGTAGVGGIGSERSDVKWKISQKLRSHKKSYVSSPLAGEGKGEG